MKKFSISFILFLFTFSILAQTIEDLNFGTDSKLDIVTWNIEGFPKSGQATIDYVAQIIEALDADIFAVQEIRDTSAFKLLVNSLDGFEGYFKSSYYSGWNLAYIYKSDIVQINDIYEIYTSPQYWSPFPRSPMVMDMNFNQERYIIINNHFKCCGNGILELNDSGDEETRRYNASNLLKEYIDSNFLDEKVIVLGDFNDILDDSPVNNVFQAFFDDESNYEFANMEIALDIGLGWSYPTWPSHLDHILITNELFGKYDANTDDIKTIRLEDYVGGWGNYDSKISDHRPVAIKITPTVISGTSDLNPTDLIFSIYPNPFKGSTTLSFKNVAEDAEIEIYTLEGKNVSIISIPKGENSIVWNAAGFPDGVYFVKLISEGNVISTKKLVLTK